MYKQKVKFVMEYPNSMLYAFFPSVPLVLFVCLSDQATMNVEDFKCTIRQIRQQEFGELSDFLYQALFFPTGEPKADRSLIENRNCYDTSRILDGLGILLSSPNTKMGWSGLYGCGSLLKVSQDTGT